MMLRAREEHVQRPDGYREHTFLPYKFGCLKFAFQGLEFLVFWCLVGPLPELQILERRSVGLQFLKCFHISSLI